MPASILQAIVLVTVPAASALNFAHGLRNGLIALKPNIVQPDRDTPLIVTTADATNINVSNPDPTNPQTANFLVQFDVSIQQATPSGAPLEYYYKGGSTAGTGFAVLNAQQTFTAGQTVAQVTLAAAANVAINAALSNNFELEIDQNLQLDNPTNVVAGMVLNFALRQDGVGGFAQTFDTAFLFEAAAPALPVGANDEYMVSCYVRAEVAGVATVMICSRTAAVS